MHLPEEELKELLTRFNGHLITSRQHSTFKSFCLDFFPSNTIPTFHTDVPIDATMMYRNFKIYYKFSESTFLSWIYYNLVKTMQHEDYSFLRYRYVNEQWYCFDNLPLFISIKSDHPSIQQNYFFMENAAHLSWIEFSQQYIHHVKNIRKSDSIIPAPYRSWYAICHLITNMPFYFNSYTPSQKNNTYYAHEPWFVISQKKNQDEKVEFTLSCTLSHGSNLPSEFYSFLEAFQKNLLTIPENQKITHYFSASP